MLEHFKQQIPVEFQTRHRAKFREIDPYGHLNTVHYLDYFIEHRFEGMRSIGIDLKTIESWPQAFYMKKIQMEFNVPVLADGLFTIRSKVNDLFEKAASVRCEMLAADQETVHAVCAFDLVCIDKQSGRPSPWSSDYIALFFQQNTHSEKHQ